MNSIQFHDFISQPTSILVFTRLENGGLGAFEVRERTPIDRMEILIKKRMFEWAIEIARRDELAEEFITVRFL